MERRQALFAGVVVLVVLVVGSGAAFLQPGGAPTTTTVFPVNGSSGSASYSAGSQHALALGLTLNRSVVAAGQALSVTVAELNTLQAPNDVPSSGSWAFQGLALGPCGTLNMPFGFKVLSGYYGDDSPALGTAQALQLYEPGFYSCPLILSSIASYSFFPSSDRASVVGPCTPEPCFTGEMNSTMTVKEYWNGSSFGNLPPGIYTLVAGDEWGAFVVAHFVVTSPGASVGISQTQLVQVGSVLGPIPPLNPGGPVVSVTLRNTGVAPIVSLQATLGLPSPSSPTNLGLPFPFSFNVTGSNPLMPGQSVTSKRALIGAGFESFKDYPIVINGNLQGGAAFSVNDTTWIDPLSYLVPNSLDSYCEGPTGYDVCFGGGLSSAEVFNCPSQAATSSGCAWKVVNSSAPQYASTVTVWYPYPDPSGGPQNCRYTDSGDSGSYYSAYCIPLNSTSFIVSDLAPPPL